MRLLPYLKLLRADHWFKNVFMLPGTAMAMVLTGLPLDLAKFLIGIASACLIASANYVLNEWLDSAFDRFHPVKKNRPSVAGDLNPRLVYAEYALVTAVGFGLGSLISVEFLLAGAALWGMAILYNVKPFRTKDRVYLDVLSESVNNPIRLALGWFIVTSVPLPPSSLTLGYWMLGAYMMGIKRYAELRSIGPETAALYRRSFRSYTEGKLLISIQFYASSASFFLGVFLVKHRIELLVTLPFIAAALAWYFHIGMKRDSAASTPERLYRETGFITYLTFVVILIGAVFVVDLPWLDWFLQNAFTNNE